MVVPSSEQYLDVLQFRSKAVLAGFDTDSHLPISGRPPIEGEPEEGEYRQSIAFISHALHEVVTCR